MGGRQCGWCWDPHRAHLEARVLAGEPITLVAMDTSYSASAAKRHCRAHLNLAQQVALRSLDSVALGVEDLGRRMLGLADEAASIRSQVTDPKIHLVSIQAEQSVLAALTAKLGIESGEALDAVREARALSAALRTVLADHPGAAAALARELTSAGEPDLARAFTSLALSARPKLREVAQ